MRLVPKMPWSRKDTPLTKASNTRTYDEISQYTRGQHIGGYVNPASGAGTGRDRVVAGGFVKSLPMSREQLDTIFKESWLANKFITIPVEDSLVRWRTFDEDTSTMAEVEEKFNVAITVGEAVIKARLYGGSLIVMITRGQTVDEPLEIENIRTNDLLNLLVLGKPDLRVEDADIDKNMESPTYGTPLYYTVINEDGEDIKVHHSRCIRFDGLRSPSEKYFGDSMLVKVMEAILEESEVSANIAYLIGEASLLIYRPDRFRETLAGNNDPDQADPESVLQRNISYRSVFRAVLADRKDELGRLTINFAGMGDIHDRFVSRASASTDIPATRLWGKSPIGMNATGDSDMANYALMVESMQRGVIGAAIKTLDEVLARTANLSKAPTFTWVSLVELSEEDRVDISVKRNQEMRENVMERLISPEEWRERMDNDLIVGPLEGPPPEQEPIPDPNTSPGPQGTPTIRN